MSRRQSIRIGLVFAAAASVILGFAMTPAYAQLLVEEQFIYELESLIHGQDGGFGFDGPWRASKSHGRDYVMQFEGLTFTDVHLEALRVAGNSLSRYGSAGRAEAHRVLSSDAQAALTGDDTTMWFSVLFQQPAEYRHTSFLFGTYKFSTQPTPQLGDGDDDRNPPFNPVEGSGLGFTVQAAPGGHDQGYGSINALAFHESHAPIVVEGAYVPNPLTATSLIAGKINWKPLGTPDELFLFAITDMSVEPEEDEAFVSITDLDFDQSAFHTVAVWDSNNGRIDEIRFGTTFAGVMGVIRCPSQLTATGGAGGVTLAWKNGDEMPTAVKVLRNGQELASAAPVDPPRYTDAGAQPGLLNYECIFTMPGEVCASLKTTYDACITDLAVLWSEEEGVVLTWTNRMAYDAIEIKRNGEVIEASLSGTAQTYTDAAPLPQGVLTYTVAPTNGTCDPATAEIHPRLVCHLPLDGDLYDATGSGNDGFISLPQEPVFVEDHAGAPGRAMRFDGIDDYIQITHAEGLPITQEPFFTIAMWVKGAPANPQVADRRVFSESSSLSNAPLFNIGIHNAGTGVGDENARVNIYIRNDANAAVIPHRRSQGVAFDDTWHHIAWVDMFGEVTLYIDGEPDPVNFSYNRPIALTVDTTTVGAILRQNWTPPVSHRFTGALDDVRLYNYALGQSQIQAIIEGTVQPPDKQFSRGDVNDDGNLNIADAIYLLAFLFAGGPAPVCPDAADANDDDVLNIADAITILSHLFAGAGPLPPPFPGCGVDPTPSALPECQSVQCP